MDQKALAGPQGARFEHIGPDRKDGFGQASSIYQVNPPRNGQHRSGRRTGDIGIAAACHQRADRLPGIETFHALAQREHMAGYFQPQSFWRTRRRGVEAHAFDDIRAVHPAGGDPYQDFARTGRIKCHLLQPQSLWPARLRRRYDACPQRVVHDS